MCAGAYLPDFNAGANRLLYVLLITLGISLLAGVIVILWFSRKLTKPILQVADQAKLIAYGNYSQENRLKQQARMKLVNWLRISIS